jgi:hypothetical protein
LYRSTQARNAITAREEQPLFVRSRTVSVKATSSCKNDNLTGAAADGCNENRVSTAKASRLWLPVGRISKGNWIMSQKNEDKKMKSQNSRPYFFVSIFLTKSFC